MRPPSKAKLVQLIQIAKRQLDMADADYRTILKGVGGVDSSTKLSYTGATDVLDHMKKLGFKVEASKNAGKPINVKPELEPLMGKISALLADMKLPWKYATSILKRQANVERLEWADAEQLHNVVTALTVRQQRGAK